MGPPVIFNFVKIMATYLTQEGWDKIKKELDHLKNVKRKEVSEKIRHTASQGDLKENAGYEAAKEEQGFVEGKIKELSQIIAQAKIIKEKDSAKVQLGSWVTVESSAGRDKFQIVGPEEADISQNRISFKSPLGEALLGKEKEEKIIIETPGGKKEYNLLKID